MTTDAGRSQDTLIRVQGLQKYFKGEEIKALDGVDAEIAKGEVVVVIGPSGSGKSTFLRCLNLLELPTGGTIEFDGMDITDKAIRAARTRSIQRPAWPPVPPD